MPAGRDKPFAWQVAFVGPPDYFDASPSDFLRLAPDNVGVASRQLISADGGEMERVIRQAAAECASSGADVVAIVGSNWSHAGLGSDCNMAAFRDRIAAACGAWVYLAPLSMVGALRASGAKRIAINAPYATPAWRAALSDFFAKSGFSVAYCGNLVDLGLVADLPTLARQGGFFPGGYAHASIAAVLDKGGEVDAVAVTGIPSFLDDVTERMQRMVHLLPELQKDVAVPIVSTDTALYEDILAHIRARDRARP